MNAQPNAIATLIHPDRGYTRIRLIEKLNYTWLAEVIGPGYMINVYEDEFIID